MSNSYKNGLIMLALIGFCFIFLLTIPMSIIGYKSILIAKTYKNVQCDNLNFISLSTWLYANAISSMLYCVIAMILCCIYIVTIADVYIFSGITISFVLLIFKIIWNILGSYFLFRNSQLCYYDARHLYDTISMILQLQWAFFGVGFYFVYL